MPLGKYENFAACKKGVKTKHPGWTDKQVSGYCGKIYWQVHGKKEGAKKLRHELSELKSELNELKGSLNDKH